FFYAQFLREMRHDVDGAVQQLEVALELDPSSARVMIQIARCNLEILSFSPARESLDDLILRMASLDRAVARDVWRLNAEDFGAHGNFSTQTKEYAGAMGSLEGLRREVGIAPPSVLDAVKPIVARAIGAVWCCINESNDDGVRVRAEAFLSWLRGLKGL